MRIEVKSQGESVSETAEILGTSVDAIKVRIHRAKKRLKEAVNKECAYYTTSDGTTRCDRKKPTGDD